MNRLTHERNNGIKTGHWSPNKKDELVERLAAYEDTGLTPEEIMDGRMLSGWIPVSEKLPDKNGTYLVTVESYDETASIPYITVDHGNCDGSFLHHSITQKCKRGKAITAWMPLPEPYMEDENDK